MVSLSDSALPDLAGRVAVPGYDRAGLEAAVVHVGVGGFHRAHQAMFHDRLLREGLGREWAIQGAGVLASDARMADALGAQDGLYTLVARAGDGSWDARVVGSLLGVLLAAEDPEPLVARLASPATRIVSLTVTEGGYTAANATFGLLADALARRRAAGLEPFTVMSCDNLEGNGPRARALVLDAAPDAGTRDWLEERGAFPASMVDRITPATTDADREEVAERLGVRDRWPVVCEPFAQWVLEDAFALGRPPYERAGVQLVDDVRPHEAVKLRLLNASHQALGHFGLLLGAEHVHDAIGAAELRAFVVAYQEEAATTLEPVEGLDVGAYRATLLERFANPHVADTTRRLAESTSDRIPRFVLPVAHDRLQAGLGAPRAAAIAAAWTVTAEEADLPDARAEALRERARASREGDGLAFLRDEELFGDLAEHEGFARPYADALARLRADGPRAALAALA